MKQTKTSSFILILMLLFIAVDLAGYLLLRDTVKKEYDQETRILFYEVKSITDELINKLLIDHLQHKEPTLRKHRIVLEYMHRHDLNSSLDKIHAWINRDDPRSPYHIYITDKNLTIINTTYQPDLGFNLSFARSLFDAHYENNETGYSLPIQNKPSNRFVSFTDSYIQKNGDPKAAILQIGYVYHDTSDIFRKLDRLIQEHPRIKEVKSYGYDSDQNFSYSIVFNNTLSHKPTAQILKNAWISVKKSLQKLERHTLKEEYHEIDGTPFRLLFITGDIGLQKSVNILYTIWIDESDLHQTLFILNLLMGMIALLGILAITTIVKIRHKEQKLSEQDNFIQSAMHEIKTPLSIITLNNELRTIEFGNDPYSQEIDSAVKTLRTSYETMGFILTKDKVVYPLEEIDLAQIIQERVDFFQGIARSNEKKIQTDITGRCIIHISHIELVRFIDNNLSNALKYSKSGSTITVTIRERTLSFHNEGDPIRNTTKIFQRYVRENTTVGGYGLGLHIIKEIAQKYDIKISVRSTHNDGTTFDYIFPQKRCTPVPSSLVQ